MFEDVEVPVGNLVGPENGAFNMILKNFNPERLQIATSSIRLARVCASDAYRYACQRETFGKRLIDHPAIKTKITNFGLWIEPAQAFREQLCHLIEVSRRTGQEINVGGLTALLKIISTRCLEQVCRESLQILGGAGYSKTGPGARIEQISRMVRVWLVGGGSEEIMFDLAGRQEIRDFESRGGTSLKFRL